MSLRHLLLSFTIRVSHFVFVFHISGEIVFNFPISRFCRGHYSCFSFSFCRWCTCRQTLNLFAEKQTQMRTLFTCFVVCFLFFFAHLAFSAWLIWHFRVKKHRNASTNGNKTSQAVPDYRWNFRTENDERTLNEKKHKYPKLFKCLTSWTS